MPDSNKTNYKLHYDLMYIKILLFRNGQDAKDFLKNLLPSGFNINVFNNSTDYCIHSFKILFLMKAIILNLSAWIVGADAEFPVSNLAIISPNGFILTISRNPHCLGT